MTRSFPQQAFSTFPIPRSVPAQTNGQKGDQECLKLIKPPRFDPRPAH